MRLFASICLVNLTCVVSASGGLIETRNHRSLALQYLRFSPGSMRLLDQGDSRWSTGLTVANEFRVRGDLLEDTEVSRFSFGYARGLADGWELAVEVPWLSRNGGFMDSIIDTWHDLVLGWSDPDRLAAPRGRSIVQFGTDYNFGSAAGLGDISLQARKRAGSGVVSVMAKVPTGKSSQLLGSGGFDFGVGVESQLELGRRISMPIYGAVVWQGKSRATGSSARTVAQLGFGIVLTPNSKDQWIAQWQHEDAPVRGANGLGPHRLLTFGYRRQLSASQTLECFFSEDYDVWPAVPLLVRTGPDFTIGVKLTFRV